MKKRILSAAVAAAMTLMISPQTILGAENDIKVGDYIQMGTYYDAPILWRCVDIDENGPLMLSDKIITLKAFDAAGLTAAGSHPRYQARRANGSNYWGDSNIRTWLNSDAEAGKISWPDKNPPTAKNIVDGYNEYDKEAGFLTAFSDGERNAIKSVSQKSIVAISDYNAGVYDTGTEIFIWKAEIEDAIQNYDTAYAGYFTDAIFLPDVKQIHTIYENRAVLGEYYYIGEPTAQCAENSDFKSSKLKPGEKWSYWIRTPYTNQDDAVTLDEGVVMRYMTSSGIFANYNSNTGNCGVRPAFYLSTAAAITSGDGTEASPYTVWADKPITVLLNDNAITFDQPPVNIDDRVMVPIRAIFEAMGYGVDWDSDTQTATAVKDSNRIVVGIGSSEISYTTDGVSDTYICDVLPQIVSERTLVPVRAISESAGCDVDWNSETQTVIITK